MSILGELNLDDLGSLLRSALLLLLSVFQIWMLIHAIRAKEWFWAIFILFFPVFGCLWYFLQVYRASPGTMQGFELPGAHHRKRIKELQTQIHHLDKAHHHSELGDIYLNQGKLLLAEGCYRTALERDPQDIDTRAHLGQCLLRQKKPAEARPWLEGVCAENPKHDYGHSLMALAETYSALGEIDKAIAIGRQVTENHTYARARVQLAELYLAKKEVAAARALLTEVVTDAAHGPAFDRQRERVWVRRARKLLGQLPA